MKYAIERDGKNWRLDAIPDFVGEPAPTAGEVALMLLDISRGVLSNTIDQTKVKAASHADLLDLKRLSKGDHGG